MASSCHGEPLSFSRAGGLSMKISTAAAQPQPPNPGPGLQVYQPKDTGLALGQLLGLFMTLYLRVCALARCTREISSPPPQSTRTSLSGRERGVRYTLVFCGCLGGPTVSPPWAHPWFGSHILRIEGQREVSRHAKAEGIKRKRIKITTTV